MLQSKVNISTEQLISFTLHLADNSLIFGHRLSEWTGHGPMLEQDIALSNIALDLIGQSRNFYQYAAELINVTTDNFQYKNHNEKITEDFLAYLRDPHDFKNIVLAELPNGDWAKTILKLFFFSNYQFLLYKKLFYSADKQLSAIAEKSLKEVTYHVRWSSEWVIRLGDGTDESHHRMANAFTELQNYTGEMFIAADYEAACALAGTGVDANALKVTWYKKINDILTEATLPLVINNESNVNAKGGKQGFHTEHLQDILSEMQYLQRTYPGCEW